MYTVATDNTDYKKNNTKQYKTSDLGNTKLDLVRQLDCTLYVDP